MRKKLSKILLTDVAEKIKPVYKTNCSRKKNFERRITTSVPKKVFCIREKLFLAKDKDKQIWDKTSWKGIQENTSLSNIYWRFYWPGSYAPRGVIDQYICLQMGAPLFLLALLSTQTQEVCNGFSLKKQIVSTKKCWRRSRFIHKQLFTFVVILCWKVLFDSKFWVLRNIIMCIFS